MTFLLVDYKGGAAFSECVSLPHTVGMVTDLSPHLVRRAITSGVRFVPGCQVDDLLWSAGRVVGVTARVPQLHLQPGRYLLDVGVRSGDNNGLDYLPGCAQVDVVPGPSTPPVIIRDSGGVRVPAEWLWDGPAPVPAPPVL